MWRKPAGSLKSGRIKGNQGPRDQGRKVQMERKARHRASRERPLWPEERAIESVAVLTYSDLRVFQRILISSKEMGKEVEVR